MIARRIVDWHIEHVPNAISPVGGLFSGIGGYQASRQ
jgi:hypothetical protein